jgi:cholesterol transport system auxiliary component
MRLPACSWLALTCAMLLATGCISVNVGGGGAVPTTLVLNDAGAGSAVKAPPAAPVLLTLVQAGDPAADSLRLAYAARPGERADTPLARWSERPERRIPALLQQRLEARGAFGAVQPIGQLASDWLLTLSVQQMVHDLTASPTQARLTLRAELIDRRSRSLVARRVESVAVPAARDDAVAAAQAFDRAVAQAFDALAPWIEDEVRRAAAAAKR